MVQSHSAFHPLDLRLTRRQIPLLALVAGIATGAPLNSIAPSVLAETTNGRVLMFLGNAARTGEMPGPSPDAANGLEERWRFSRGNGTSASMVVDGVVYASNSDGNLYVLNLADGSERWHVALDGEISGPAIAGDVIYLCGLDGILYALDIQNGAERWRFTSAVPLTDLIVANDTVFVRSRQNMSSVDATDGSERWRFAIPESEGFNVSISTDGGVVFGVTSKGMLYAIGASDGNELWRFQAGDWLGIPAAAGGNVYFGNTDGSFYALDAQTGIERWHFYIGRASSTPAIANGVVYAFGDNQLLALDAQLGSVRWRLDSGEMLHAPVVVGDLVITASAGGAVYAIDAAQGSVRWRIDLGEEVYWPVVVDGLLLLASDGGTLRAMGAKAAIFEPGARARVKTATNLRGAPSSTSADRGELQEGAVVLITGASQAKGGANWWPVTVEESALNGWVEQSTLELIGNN